MVSSTKQTERRRRMKAATAARGKKSARAAAGTPKVPIHPEAAAPAKKA